MDLFGTKIGAFKHEEITQMSSLLKIIENGAGNDFVTASLFRMIISLVLKLNEQMIDNEKTKRLQIEEIVGAVNFLKSRVCLYGCRCGCR